MPADLSKPSRRQAARLAVVAALATASALALPRASAASGSGSGIRFSRDVLPVLSDHCFQCHGPDAGHRKAGLRLDSLEGARTGGKSGRPAVVPGQSDRSELVRRLFSTDPDEVMPPPSAQKPLDRRAAELLRRWVDEGAAWGRHWAFETPQRPGIPEVRQAEWPRGAIDRFVLARLEREGLSPAPEAARETLLRRVSLDLTGLPPTSEEAAQFQSDNSPQAYERLVDRLLASPAFGERMAWDWLEAARYADSNGYQGDSDRTMWPWRDWVVRAFNDNLRYDQFTVWQLAGDLLPRASFEQKLATGFCRNHPINGEGGRIPEENRVDYVMDMAETTGTVWLGLTFNCCRCHDHKFDPLTRRDYYGLFAFFNQTPVDGGGGNPQTPPVVEVSSPGQQLRLAELDAAVEAAAQGVRDAETELFPPAAGTESSRSSQAAPAAEVPDKIRAILRTPAAERSAGKLSDLEKHFEKARPDYAARVRTLKAAVEARAAFRNGLPRVMVMADADTPRRTFMLEKGLYNQPGQEVFAATPAHLPPLPEALPTNRLALARWLVAPANPLTARVTVNHFWQALFGVGLVKTPEDFGVQGEFPSHPELLDWLGVEFVESGWDVKRLLRLMVTSSAYRQSSHVTPALAERDPANRLLARGPRFRMPSWMLRDQALAASGLLARPLGGPPVKPYQPDGVWDEATFGNRKYRADTGEGLYRRSLYTFWRRIVGPTLFFDTPSRSVCAVKPMRTNTPLQALATLNDVTYVEAARALATQLLRQPGSVASRLDLAFRRVLARAPKPAEASLLAAALDRAHAGFAADTNAAARFITVGESRAPGDLDAAELAAWTTVCLTLLNLDETLTKE